jgi:uncharacterized repeat protein (TIGR03803 family)
MIRKARLAAAASAPLVVLTATAPPASALFIQTLGNFSETTGINPIAEPTLSADGTTLYGTTQLGNGGHPSVWSEPVTGGTPHVLGTFDSSTGQFVNGPVTIIGNTLYGTAASGGANNSGTVYSMPIAGGTPTVLGSFNGAGNGTGPFARLVIVASTIYGVASTQGAAGSGTLFSLPITGGTPTPLVAFDNTSGRGPGGSPTLVGTTFYGETASGGVNNCGTVYSVPITGGTPTVLASFDGTNGHQGNSNVLVIGSTIYGSTVTGGLFGDGDIYSLPITGGTPTILASFNGADGNNPEGILTLSADGTTIYGTTVRGGPSDAGVVYSLPLTGGTPNVLASFNVSNGKFPEQGLALGNDGTLYGTTALGGDNSDGTVYAVVPEPAAVGMMLILCGAAMLRRRRDVSA